MSSPLDFDRSLLPSLEQLQRASGVAAVVVLLLGVTVVLPAERGEDPTGVGTALGLTAMGQLRMEAARSDQYVEQSGEMSLELAPGKSREIKLSMGSGHSVEYRWTASSGELFYDLHGEPLRGAAGSFQSYEKATKPEAAGTFEAPFEGTHGWYWKNKTDAPITVTLSVEGRYGKMKRLD